MSRNGKENDHEIKRDWEQRGFWGWNLRSEGEKMAELRSDGRKYSNLLLTIKQEIILSIKLILMEKSVDIIGKLFKNGRLKGFRKQYDDRTIEQTVIYKDK